MGVLWDLVKGAASSTLDRKAIQYGADKILLDAGFNILSINKKIREAANSEVDEFFIKNPEGTSINYYEAALLKINLIYAVAKKAGNKTLMDMLDRTFEKIKFLGTVKYVVDL